MEHEATLQYRVFESRVLTVFDLDDSELLKLRKSEWWFLRPSADFLSYSRSFHGLHHGTKSRFGWVPSDRDVSSRPATLITVLFLCSACRHPDEGTASRWEICQHRLRVVVLSRLITVGGGQYSRGGPRLQRTVLSQPIGVIILFLHDRRVPSTCIQGVVSLCRLRPFISCVWRIRLMARCQAVGCVLGRARGIP